MITSYRPTESSLVNWTRKFVNESRGEGGMIHKLDNRLQQAAQDAYTYAWDRWGIYIGTVRLFLITVAIVLFQMRLPYDSPLAAMGIPTKPTLPGIFGLVTVWSVLFYFPHGYVQRLMQREARWPDLFALSETFRTFGPLIRLAATVGFFTGIEIGYAWTGHIVEPGNVLRSCAIVCVYAYLYSLGVYVGPRNRVRLPKATPQAAQAR
jgi:hypothetical protein